MLSRRLAALLVASLAAIGAMPALSWPAAAAGPPPGGVGVRCDPITQRCTVAVWHGGSPGSGSGPGGPGDDGGVSVVVPVAVGGAGGVLFADDGLV